MLPYSKMLPYVNVSCGGNAAKTSLNVRNASAASSEAQHCASDEDIFVEDVSPVPDVSWDRLQPRSDPL